MCNVKYIICTIFCICTYCHAVTACSDSSTNRFSYKIIEKFDYCWDNNIICADTNFTDTTLFISSHKYIIYLTLFIITKTNRQSWIKSDIVVNIITLKPKINQRRIYNITL